MSLNPEQRDGTRRELLRNLELSTMTVGQIAAEIGITEARAQAAVQVTPDADPADVWKMRDALETAVRAAGRTPERYTVLDEASREDAQRWFGLPRRR